MNNDQLYGNYHTHTYRCKHATGDAAEYADEAVKRGLKVLGFSEHTPFPDDRWNDVRLDYSQLEEYDLTISRLKKERTDIQILKGMECDWVEEFKNFYIDDYRGKRKFDFLIGSIHWFPVDGEWVFTYAENAAGHVKEYTEHLIKMIESEMFDFIGHPDLFARFTRKWDKETDVLVRDICRAAESVNVPLEINGYGFRKGKIETEEGIRFPYPHERFWEIASEYKIRVICNSDAHKPEDVNASIDLCMEIADRYSLAYADMSYLHKKGDSKKYA